MSNSWTKISTILSGDISYVVRIIYLCKQYVDIAISSYSDKWNQFDAKIEYRLNESDGWMSDISISQSTASAYDNNTLYGIQASKYGTQTTLRWKYTKNNANFGQQVDIRLRPCPSFHNFITSQTSHLVTYNGRKSYTNLVASSQNRKPISFNNNGKYICLKNDSVYVIDQLSLPEDQIEVSYDGLSSPSHASQIDSGNYLVADTDNNRVIEISEDMSSISNTYAVSSPVFTDYAHEGKLTLITAGNFVYEVSMDSGNLIWQYPSALNNPSSATYAHNNTDEIVISDYGNNRIIIYDRASLQETVYDQYYADDARQIPFLFEHPFRAYKTYDGTICVIEQTGRGLSFSDVSELTSSSSSSSSSSGV